MNLPLQLGMGIGWSQMRMCDEQKLIRDTDLVVGIDLQNGSWAWPSAVDA
ncbi:hypothetical protein [Thermoactinomyces mirandus]|uniref:Uncharacterized protein n=1 Tax=Thermoactinomyces mirandus TaxID=2756294 RepID=A0A7W2AQC0_9BACL|nr:hypothetical protein [Thermoactinomyces mirandus]MBA4601358.1 hypothetical protein [Thermoactinomyces mirandus]